MGKRNKFYMNTSQAICDSYQPHCMLKILIFGVHLKMQCSLNSLSYEIQWRKNQRSQAYWAFKEKKTLVLTKNILLKG